MTDSYVEQLLIEKFKELNGLEEVFEQATIYSEEDVYYVEDEEEYVVAEPQPTTQEEIDEGEYFIVSYPEVAFPNKAFERPDDGYWYELFFLPSVPVQKEMGKDGRSLWVGVLQINVCVPKNVGIKALNDRYDNIAQLYRSSGFIDGVRIVRTYRTSALDDGDFYVLPVSVEWQAYLER